MVRIKIQTNSLNVWYGDNHVLQDVKLAIPERHITAIIGPSGCGKTTLLKSLNRMVELIEGARVEGRVLLDGRDIYDSDMDPAELRRRVGMVFQKPNPLPMSIYDNVAYGLRVRGIDDRVVLDEAVEEALERAGLWSEVKERLRDSAFNLSIGQQQRLCIARALAVGPDVLLLDEPCSSLDPISTRRIESLLTRLKNDLTLVIVTHNLQQARRIADYTAFLYMGRLVEMAPTEEIFEKPREELTRNYIEGRFG
ncbi:phosphate ABC transporter ATP-binding protein [Candidatus Bathyarchaeota archaeon]|nr:phosphate ABC transporter ATP-binding protein [Candidatus Bathyarchaeota archaeon]